MLWTPAAVARSARRPREAPTGQSSPDKGAEAQVWHATEASLEAACTLGTKQDYLTHRRGQRECPGFSERRLRVSQNLRTARDLKLRVIAQVPKTRAPTCMTAECHASPSRMFRLLDRPVIRPCVSKSCGGSGNIPFEIPARGALEYGGRSRSFVCIFAPRPVGERLFERQRLVPAMALLTPLVQVFTSLSV